MVSENATFALPGEIVDLSDVTPVGVLEALDVPAAPSPATLSDEALIAGGLERQVAWVRAIPAKQNRKARNTRYREKQEQDGVVQVSLRIPADLSDSFKALAVTALETGQLTLPETDPQSLAGVAGSALDQASKPADDCQHQEKLRSLSDQLLAVQGRKAVLESELQALEEQLQESNWKALVATWLMRIGYLGAFGIFIYLRW